jgi:multicomponent Na+:H+ antiporter subunit B
VSPSTRRALFLLAALPLAGWLAWGLAGLPGFGKYPGPYGDVINSVCLYERHLANAVTAINFDYRGLDTLGEEFILFAAVTGVVILLRDQPDADKDAAEEQLSAPGRTKYRPSEAVQWMGYGLVGIIVLFGIDILIHPQPSPGGGFQGGAIIGTASILICLVTNHRVYGAVIDHAMADLAEAIGAGGYALLGLGTLAAGGAFLQNMLPLGTVGSITVGGTIPLINFLVGVEVAAGFAVLFLEFFKEVRRPPPGQSVEGKDDSRPSPPAAS